MSDSSIGYYSLAVPRRLQIVIHGLGSIHDDNGDRNTRSCSSTKLPTMKKKSFDDRKQGTHLNTLFCPAASCGPGEVRGFASSLWPNDSCANRGVRVKEDGKNELPKKGTHARANLPTRLAGVSQNQHLPHHTHKFLQKNNATSVKVLQKNIVEKLQTSVELHACSLRDDEKAVMHLPKIMHLSQQLQQKNTFSSEKVKKMEEVEKAEWNPLTDDWSLTPWMDIDNVSDDQWFDEWFEEVTCQVELKKNETKKENSFQAGTRSNVILPKIGPVRQSALPKTEYSVKQLNSSGLPFPLLGNRRPGSDKTSKARAHKKTNSNAFKPACAAQE